MYSTHLLFNKYPSENVELWRDNVYFYKLCYMHMHTRGESLVVSKQTNITSTLRPGSILSCISMQDAIRWIEVLRQRFLKYLQLVGHTHSYMMCMYIYYMPKCIHAYHFAQGIEGKLDTNFFNVLWSLGDSDIYIPTAPCPQLCLTFE